MYLLTCSIVLLFALILPSFRSRLLREAKGAPLLELRTLLRWVPCIMIGLTLVVLMGINTTGVAMTGESSSPNPPSSPNQLPVQSSGSPKFDGVTIEKCANEHHILPPGNINTDLEIDGVSCTIDGNAPEHAYVYRNVNIWGGDLR